MRSDKFAVEVKDCENSKYDGRMDISVTHNGHQWWTTWLNIEEWPEVVAAVESYLEAHKGDTDE